jgi:hypothetical protein
MIGLIIVFVVCLVLFVFSVRMAIITSKAKKQRKINTNNKMAELGAYLKGTYKHIVGLSLPENIFCNVYLCNEKVVIEGNGVTFNLSKEKITDVCIKTETEIQQQYVSSIGGAVAGGVLFGPLGAIVGGRTKKKRDKKITQFLIYTYEKDNTIDYISFEIVELGFNALKFVEDFKKNNINNSKEINL